MFNNTIKIFFMLLGAITGYTVVKTFLSLQNIELSSIPEIAAFSIVSFSFAVIFYYTGSKIISITIRLFDKIEVVLQKMTLYELLVSAIGLIAGLVIANLVTIPVMRVDIVGVPISIIVNILFGCVGIGIANSKKNEQIFEAFRDKKTVSKLKGTAKPKLLDTSVIIDGRIVDICRAGFIEGDLVIPTFVLEELRHIADSTDALKRNRGRRGLDVLNMLQKELEHPVRIENIGIIEGAEVDDKLLKAAKDFDYTILTIDYNLNKVAVFSGVSVLNINELTNAVKPIALPGEEMNMQVVKDGKENGQGIGYLDDGTMIVVEGGKRHIGETINVTVTSVLQTAAGRMIFAKPKFKIEKVV